jgi:hypothetical protein
MRPAAMAMARLAKDEAHKIAVNIPSCRIC